LKIILKKTKRKRKERRNRRTEGKSTERHEAAGTVPRGNTTGK